MDLASRGPTLVITLVFTLAPLVCHALSGTAFADEVIEKINEEDNYSEAQHTLTGLIESGVYTQEIQSRFLNELGDIEFFGKFGNRANLEKAFDYYNQTAAHGDPYGLFKTGLMYEYRLNPREPIYTDDRVRTLSYDRAEPAAFASLNYYLSSLGDEPRAQAAMGYRHLAGIGIRKNCTAANLYYSKVARRVYEDQSQRNHDQFIERVRLDIVQGNKNSLDPSLHFEIDEDIVNVIQSRSSQSNPLSLIQLATLYFYGGKGLKKDYSKAYEHWKRASDLGQAGAKASLGYLYLKGFGVPKDYDAAFKYFQEAAEDKNLKGINGLAYSYMYGVGIPKNETAAYEWFKKGADLGHADSQYNFASMLMLGTVEEGADYNRAFKYFGYAAHQGHSLAMYNMGVMHNYGIGTYKSCEASTKLFKEVAERGSWADVVNMARRKYMKGHIKEAALLYLEAATQGFEVAQINVASILDKHDVFEEDFVDHKAFFYMEEEEAAEEARRSGNSTFSKKLARILFTRSAAQGDVSARLKLGDYFYHGIGTERNLQKSLAYYNSIDNLRGPQAAQALFNLGIMHHFGQGLAKDYPLAKRYYDRALAADDSAYWPTTILLNIVRYNLGETSKLVEIKLELIRVIRIALSIAAGISIYFGIMYLIRRYKLGNS